MLKSGIERTKWIIHEETHREVIAGTLTLVNKMIWHRREGTHSLSTLGREDN